MTMAHRDDDDIEDRKELNTKPLNPSNSPKPILGLKTFPNDFFTLEKVYGHQRMAARETQLFLYKNKARIFILRLATASGKTVYSIACSRGWVSAGGERSFIIAPPHLHPQILAEFRGVDEALVLPKRTAFICPSVQGASCGSLRTRRDCSHHKDKTCPYIQARDDAHQKSFDKKRIVVVSLGQWLSLAKNEKFKHLLPSGGGMLTIDEAHTFPREVNKFIDGEIDLGFLMNFISQRIASNVMAGMGNFQDRYSAKKMSIDDQASLLEMSAWLRDYAGLVADALYQYDEENLDELIPFLDSSDVESIDQFTEYLKRAADRFSFAAENVTESRWFLEIRAAYSPAGGVGDMEPNTSPIEKKKYFNLSIPIGKSIPELKLASTTAYVLRLRSIEIPPAFLRNLFAGFSKAVFMSGTLFPMHIARLGLISKSDMTEDGELLGVRTFTAKSNIASWRRMMYVDKKNGVAVKSATILEDYKRMASNIVTRILPKFAGQRAFIHVHNNQQATILAQAIRLKALDRNFPIQLYTESDPGGFDYAFKKYLDPMTPGDPTVRIVIGIKRYEGLNLSDDRARLIIIARTPRLNPYDPLISALESVYKGLTIVETVTAILQAKDRGVRHQADGAVIICLDLSALRELSSMWDDLPQYDQECIVETDDDDYLQRAESFSSP
ncbi:MAG: hypothetical protein EOP06_05715 [Proteobacteria bacterium]|nr:MAG: hypothetical protein EOP06_05715 [Pseudomonadota bacterium]